MSIKVCLVTVSGVQIDRLLMPERKAQELRGIRRGSL
jgi:hypothetical protein